MKYILGIDEVGRGPWAGPLVIGACVLNPRFDDDENPVASENWQEKLADSKKLTAKKREELDKEIREKAASFGLGWVSASELDKIGLSEALKLASRRAVEKIKTEPTEIIIDGTQNFLKGTRYEEKVTVLKKADDKIKEVSAASIIAKVARDNYMVELAKKYPEYGFEKHVGYGTAKHKAALEAKGPCPEHRFSFRPVAVAGNVFNDPAEVTTEQERRSPVTTAPWDAERSTGRADACRKNISTTAIGRKAEKIVAEELTRRGHKILARNYKTKFYEIDIISATKDHIYFTEVKYRRTKKYGDPLEFIDKEKMTFAAELFMKTLAKKLPEKTLPSPILAAASVTTEDFALENWLELED
ncbi:ribonuclease HII [Candidatus Saccharibacteria bacterium]|nr:ribonuclease HII [Candidatus Saccharibacteria bacterium]